MILPTARFEICLICLLLLSDGRLALGDELLMESPLSPIDSEIDVDQVSTTQRTPVISTSEPIEAQPQECGLTNLVATPSLQTLLSPQWPSATMLSIQCSWYISAPEGLRVELSFFSIEIAACCDSIVIEGIESDDGQRTVTLRSSTRDTFVSRTGGMLRITYNSYGLMPMRGFRANYISKNPFAPTTAPVTTDTTTEPPLYTLPPGRRRSCGGTGKRVLVGQYYFLQSPYRYSRECRWRLFAPQNFLVKLVFIDFNVVPDSATFELLEVKRPKVDWDTAKVLLQLSEDRAGFEYTFDSNLGGIRYRSDNDDSSFMILYYAVPASCGSEVTASNTIKNIQSPSYPKLLYKGELNCTWSIRSQVKGAKIYLVFTTLETTQGKDSLKVYDGEALVPESELIENQVYVSNTDQLKVVFTSVEHYGLKGFQASYYTDEVATTTPAITQRLPRRPNTCGKVLRRVNLGQKLILRSPRREKNCRWRLQTDKGVSIKLTFLEYELDPAQASLKLVDIRGFRFQWDTLPVLLDESNITVGRVFHYPRNIGGIIYESGTKDSLVSVQYEAYLPKGSCGFTDFASNKWRQLKSPGYPRRYPEKMDCTWTIRARGTRRIELIIGEIQVASGDKVQMYDGSVLVYEYSSVIFGDVPDIRKEFISSARRGFTIRFIAQAGDEMSGFSARYRYARARRGGTTTMSSTPSTDTATRVITRSTTASTTEIQTTSSERTEPTQSSTMVTEITTAFTQALNRTAPKESLKCYQIIIADIPGNVLNMNRTQSCPDESICFFANITSSVEIEGYDEKNTMTTLYGACLPKAAKGFYGCNEIFDSISSATTVVPNADIKVESCGYKYCETDLCNDNRDLQISTSYTPVNKSSVGEPLRCFAITKTILPEYGTITSDTRSVIQCPANSKCQLTFVKSQVSTAGTTVKVEVTQGNCVPEFQCSMDLCSQLDDVAPMVGTDATFTDCQSSCCDGNLCNDDIIQSTTSAMITLTNERVTTETQQTSKTTTSEAAATQPERTQPTQSSTMVTEITTAFTQALSRTPAKESLKCYQIVIADVPGIVLNINRTQSCPDESVCFFANITSSVEITGNDGKNSMTTLYGACLPKAAKGSYGCNEIFDSISSAFTVVPNANMTVESCGYKYCETNLCNDNRDLQISTSFTPVNKSLVEEPLQCFAIMKTFLPEYDMFTANTRSVVQCPANSKCQLTFVKSEGSTAVEVTQGNCVPAFQCSMDPCRQLDDVAPIVGTGATFTDCRSSCCDGNLCNDDIIQSTTSAMITPTNEMVTTGTLQTSKTTTSEAAATQPDEADYLECYSIQKAVLSMNGTPVTNFKNVTACDQGSKCAVAVASATVQMSGSSMDVEATYGFCLPSLSCNENVCDYLDPAASMQGVDMKFTSCRAACCDGNLCNDPSILLTAISTTPMLTSTEEEITEAISQTEEITSPLATLPTTAEPTDPLQCYSMSKVVTATGLVVVDISEVVICPSNSKCVSAEAKASVATFGFDMAVDANYGNCVPAGLCSGDPCDTILSSAFDQVLDVTIKSCAARCCDNSLCNGGPKPTSTIKDTQSTTETSTPEVTVAITEATTAIIDRMTTVLTTTSAEEISSLTCYSINKISSLTTGIISNNKTVDSCPAGSRCLLANVSTKLDVSGLALQVQIVYGACVPSLSCVANLCDILSPLVARQGFSAEFDSCDAYCCDSDLCNNDVTAATPSASSAISTTLKLPSTGEEITEAIRPTEAITSPLATFPTTAVKEPSDPLQCYSMSKVVTATGLVVVDISEVMICPSNSKCISAEAKASVATFGFDMDVDVNYGNCVTAGLCSGDPCDTILSSAFDQVLDVTVKSCAARCCDNNLCNGGAKPTSTIKDTQSTTTISTEEEITESISQTGAITSPLATLPTTAVADITEPSDPLQCYSISKVVTLTGLVIVDTSTVMTCPSNSKCISAQLQATVTTSGFDMDANVNYGHCVTAELCSDNPCDQLDQVYDTILNSCTATCCDNNLCNGGASPTSTIKDTQSTTMKPPSLTTAMVKTTQEITTVISAMVSSTRAILTTAASIEPTDSVESVKCYTLTRATSPLIGTVLVDTKSIQTCLPQFKCMLVDAKAKVDVQGFSVDVDVTYGSCLPAVSCNTNICDSVPPIGLEQGFSLNFISCDASCCDGDLCNDLPTLATAIPSASPSLPKTVTPPSLTTAMIKTTKEITTMISAMVSSTRALESTTQASTTAESGPSIVTTTASIEPTDSVESLKCYTLTRATTPQMGTVLINSKSVQTCPLQSKCMLVDAKAYFDVPSFSVDVDVTYGSCLPAVSCNTNICDHVPLDDLAQELSINFISCNASCCDGDLCNDLPTQTTAIPSASPSLPTTVTPPSLATAMIKTTKESTTAESAISQTTADSVASLRCYTLTRVTSPLIGTVLVDTKSVQTCLPQFKCMLVDAKAKVEVQGFSVDVEVSYGSCLPSVSCNTNICDSVPPIGLEQGLSLNFISCDASCCEGDLCNDLPTQTTAIPSASSSLPTTGTTALPPVGIDESTTGSKDSLKCYVINKVTNPLTGTLISDTKTIMTCPDNSACLLADADASMSAAGFEMNVVIQYGLCVTALSCGGNLCEGLSSRVIMGDTGFIIGSCKATCCSEDLCNEGSTMPGSSMLTPTVPDVTEEDITESPIVVTTEIDIADRNLSEEDFRNLFGYTTESPTDIEKNATSESSTQATVMNATFTSISRDILTTVASLMSNTTDSKPTSESSAGIATEGPEAKCYNIRKSVFLETSTTVEDLKTEVTCGDLTRCMFMNATAQTTIDGTTVNVLVNYGECVSEKSCQGDTCDYLFRAGVGAELSMTLTSCSAYCCEGDLCNDGLQSTEQISRPTETTTPMIIESQFPPTTGDGVKDMRQTTTSTATEPTSESPAGVATEGPEARCYYIRKSVFLETSTTVEDLKTEVTCGDLTRCMFMNATAQATIDGTTVNVLVNYGECVSEKSCQGDTCDYLFRAGVGAELSMTLTSCSAYCCEGDLCNDGPRSTEYVSLPTETTTSVITQPQYMPTTSDDVKDIIPTTTASPVIDGVLRCYAIDNMTMLDLNIVIADEREPRECEAGTRCVLIKSNGILNGNIQVQSFYGACVDESDCVSDPCTTFSEQIRQSGRLVEYTSCTSQCCETDLCNDFIPEPVTAQPDATQTVPPSTTVSAGPSCFNSMEIIIHPFERPVINTTGRKSCKQQEQCMFVTADYISQDNGSITINYGDCVEESICSNRLCDDQLKNIAAIGDEMSLQNCNITCCDNDFCNEKEKLGIEMVAKPTTVPVIGASETTTGGARALGPQLSCFKIDRNVIGGEVSSDTVQMVQCPPGSKCTYYSTTTELFGLKVENTFASCVPEMLCSVNPCTGITQLFSMNSATECLSYCCSEDFCNGQNRTEDTSTPLPDDGDIKSGLQCYQMDKTTPAVLFGADMSEEKIVTCPSSSKCSYTKSAVNIFGVEVTTETASCKAESLCDDSFCEGLANALSCTTYCCDSDLCNKADETVTESTISSPTPIITTPPEAGTTAAAPGPQLQCYNIRQIKSAEQTFDEAVFLQNCSALDTGCVLVKTVLEGERFFIPQLEVISGGCTTAEYCGLESCNVVKRLVPELPGLTFKLSQCQAACCADSKCNSLDSEQVWQQKLIEDDPAPGTTAPTLPRPIRCYSTDFTIIGGSEVENKRDEIECAPDSVCGLIRMTAYIGGVESNTVIGTCYSRSAARTSSCGKVVEDFKQRYGNDTDLPAIIEECQLALCEGDLCNDDTLSADKTEATTGIRPTDLLNATSVPVVTTALPRECYNSEDSGQSYRGTASSTISGITCQSWSSQTPHAHIRTPEDNPEQGLDSNYCRNPDDSERPWCFTNDPNVWWEYCDISVCEDSSESSTQSIKSTTAVDTTRRPATSNTATSESWTMIDATAQDLITMVSNSIRGTGAAKATTGSRLTDVRKSTSSAATALLSTECYNSEDSGQSYRGTASSTISGITCQSWSSQTPHAHIRIPEDYPEQGLDSNYCRNPDDSERPWCFTIDPNVWWEYCDISKCGAWSESSTPSSVSTTTTAKTRRPVTTNIATSESWNEARTNNVTMHASKTTSANFITTAASGCRENEFQISDYCYWIDIKRWGTHSFYSAYAQCVLSDSVISDISDADQFNKIKEHIRERIPTSWNHVFMWTGLRLDRSTSPATLSGDGDGVYAEWSPGNPKETTRNANVVLVVHKASGVKWEGMRDMEASTTVHGFICQRPLSAAKASTTISDDSAATTTTPPLSFVTSSMSPNEISQHPISTPQAVFLDCYNFSDNGARYRGKVAVTKSGLCCQHWNSQFPHIHNRKPENQPEAGLDENYCRNPYGQDLGGPWCYTTDPETRWEPCDVPKCEDNAITTTMPPSNSATSSVSPTANVQHPITTSQAATSESRIQARMMNATTQASETTISNFITVTTVASGCRNDEFQISEFCYRIEIARWGTYSFYSATSLCASADSVVSDIVDASQFNKIKEHIREEIPATWDHVFMWTGLQFDRTTSTVTLSGNEGEAYVEWSPDHPKETRGRTNIVLVVHKSTGALWEGMRDFAPYTAVHGFICRRPLSPAEADDRLSTKQKAPTTASYVLEDTTASYVLEEETGYISDSATTTTTSAPSNDTTSSVIATENVQHPTSTSQAHCYSFSDNGAGYRGKVSVTKSGLRCQNWNSQFPHDHTRTTENLPENGLDANYCRNPDGKDFDGGVWCYTTDPGTRWELCDVPKCEECYDPFDSTSYRGNVSITITGSPCFDWSSQLPREHTRTPENYPNSGLVGSYCRNPEGRGRPWCYTAGPNEWEYCYVGSCPANCYNAIDAGATYRGPIRRTISGLDCQDWSSQTPHEHERTLDNYPQGGLLYNFCRNPDGSDRPWCYTTDPEIRWQYCNVKKCEDNSGSLPSPNSTTAKSTISATTTAAQEENCRDEEFQIDGFCYWLKITWWGTQDYPTATSSCSETGSVVADIFNEELYNQLISEIRAQTPENWDEVFMWTGLQFDPNNSTVSLGTGEELTFSDWSPYHPFLGSDRNNIVVVVHKKPGHEQDGMRSVPPSFKTHGYICQRSLRLVDETTTAATTETTHIQTAKDCYSFADAGAGYRGKLATTRSGRICQNWDSQYPHEHSRSPDRYTESGLDANFCRNPDGEDSPWCYTIDPTTRWEYCDMDVCAECYDVNDSGASYRGEVHQTTTGTECQAWSAQSPHQHSRTIDNYPLSGLVGNSCRNPDGENAPWCYTVGSVRWEYCPVPMCPVDCYDRTDSGSTYRGTISETETRRKCQDWSSQYPHNHHRTTEDNTRAGLRQNYCRNPDGSDRPWCYTTDPDTRWEYCSIPSCGNAVGEKSCYHSLKVIRGPVEIINTGDNQQCQTTETCISLLAVGTVDNTEYKLSYGGCMPTSECNKTTCQDLVSLLPAELRSMAFFDCNKECCGKPLCNDVINTVNVDPTNEPPQAHKPLTLSERIAMLQYNVGFFKSCSLRDYFRQSSFRTTLALMRLFNGSSCSEIDVSFDISHKDLDRHCQVTYTETNSLSISNKVYQDLSFAVKYAGTLTLLPWTVAFGCGEKDLTDVGYVFQPLLILCGEGAASSVQDIQTAAWVLTRHLYTQDRGRFCRDLKLYQDLLVHLVLGENCAWQNGDPTLRDIRLSALRIIADISRHPSINICKGVGGGNLSMIEVPILRTVDASVGTTASFERFTSAPTRKTSSSFTTAPFLPSPAEETTVPLERFTSGPTTTITATSTSAFTTALFSSGPAEECYSVNDFGASYRGEVHHTTTGTECQAWSAQSPHQHSRTIQNYPFSGLVGNYCRNPDGENAPWCYTVGSVRWEYCPVPMCPETSSSVDKLPASPTTATSSFTTASFSSGSREGPCRQNEFEIDGVCYWLVIESDRIYDFNGAASKCSTGNSAVADIVSEKQYEQLFGEVRKMSWDGTFVKIWTALWKKEWSEVVLLSDGQPAPYLQWQLNEPTNGLFTTNIMIMVTRDPRSFWQGMKDDEPSYRAHGVLCQRQPTAETTAQAHPTADSSTGVSESLERFTSSTTKTTTKTSKVFTTMPSGPAEGTSPSLDEFTSAPAKATPSFTTASFSSSPDEGPCQHNEFVIDGVCYWLAIESDRIYDINDAASKCSTGNSAIADIVSEKQYEQIFVEVRKMSWDGTFVKIWTALWKKEWSEVVLLSDGQPAPYLQWQLNEPTNGLFTTNIMIMVTRDPRSFWQGMKDEKPSYRAHGVLCHRQPTVETTAQAHSTADYSTGVSSSLERFTSSTTKTTAKTSKVFTTMPSGPAEGTSPSLDEFTSAPAKATPSFTTASFSSSPDEGLCRHNEFENGGVCYWLAIDMVKKYDFNDAGLKCGTGNSTVADIVSEEQYEQILIEIRKMQWDVKFVKMWIAIHKRDWGEVVLLSNDEPAPFLRWRLNSPINGLFTTNVMLVVAKDPNNFWQGMADDEPSYRADGVVCQRHPTVETTGFSIEAPPVDIEITSTIITFPAAINVTITPRNWSFVHYNHSYVYKLSSREIGRDRTAIKELKMGGHQRTVLFENANPGATYEVAVRGAVSFESQIGTTTAIKIRNVTTSPVQAEITNGHDSITISTKLLKGDDTTCSVTATDVDSETLRNVTITFDAGKVGVISNLTEGGRYLLSFRIYRDSNLIWEQSSLPVNLMSATACNARKLHLTFLVDLSRIASSSFSEMNFYANVRSLIKDVLVNQGYSDSSLDIPAVNSSAGVQVVTAIYQFRTRRERVTDVNKYLSEDQVYQCVECNSWALGSKRAIYRAIDDVIVDIQAKYPVKDNCTKELVVVITTGRATDVKLKSQADSAIKDRRMPLYVLGIPASNIRNTDFETSLKLDGHEYHLADNFTDASSRLNSFLEDF